MLSLIHRRLPNASGNPYGLLIAAFLIACSGCGGREKSIPVAVKSPTDQARAILEQFAAAGETDSSIVTLRELIEAMASKDASKSGLVSDCEALMSLQGKEQVKAKVEEMLGKLP